LDNFSKNEIAYCSSKKNPKLCFCGRFAAKEAIVKADNRYLNSNFSDMEIKVSSSGAPVFKGMNISISHVNIKDISFSTAIAKKMKFDFT
jgi:phosphopantetheine--protein transferase-like protein